MKVFELYTFLKTEKERYILFLVIVERGKRKYKDLGVKVSKLYI